MMINVHLILWKISYHLKFILFLFRYYKIKYYVIEICYLLIYEKVRIGIIGNLSSESSCSYRLSSSHSNSSNCSCCKCSRLYIFRNSCGFCCCWNTGWNWKCCGWFCLCDTAIFGSHWCGGYGWNSSWRNCCGWCSNFWRISAVQTSYQRIKWRQ